MMYRELILVAIRSRSFGVYRFFGLTTVSKNGDSSVVELWRRANLFGKGSLYIHEQEK